MCISPYVRKVRPSLSLGGCWRWRRRGRSFSPMSFVLVSAYSCQQVRGGCEQANKRLAVSPPVKSAGLHASLRAGASTFKYRAAPLRRALPMSSLSPSSLLRPLQPRGHLAEQSIPDWRARTFPAGLGSPLKNHLSGYAADALLIGQIAEVCARASQRNNRTSIFIHGSPASSASEISHRLTPQVDTMLRHDMHDSGR